MPAVAEHPLESPAATAAFGVPDADADADAGGGAEAAKAAKAAKAKSRAAALAARVAAFRRETVVVDYANRGVSVPEIAARLGISEAEARKKLRAALVRMLPETPEDFAALQMSRLNEALLVAFSAMETMGLKAVDRVIKILRALERQHAAARSLALAGAAEPIGRAPEDAADAPAGRRERNPIAAQPLEKAENRSRIADPPPAATEPAPASPPVLRGDGASDRDENRRSHAQPADTAGLTPGTRQPSGGPVPTASQRLELAAILSGASVHALAAAGT